jgi:hypothetical protein
MVQKVGAPTDFVSKFSTDELAQGVIERLQVAAADRQAAA